MTPTDTTRPADGPGPDSGHAETHDAREGLRGLLGDRYGAFATALLHSAERLAEVTAERDALRGQLFDAGYREAEMRAEIAALREGRCLADITHRDEDHRQSVCMLPKDHAPLMHDDCMGCTWTDAEHWEASAVDRVANALASHPDPTCDEYVSEGPISCGWKRALIDVRWALADGSGS